MDGDSVGQVSVRFVGENGKELGGAGILLPTDVTSNQLQILCNQLLDSSDDPVPISFFTEDGVEIQESIQNSMDKIDLEKTLCLIYQPQAVFRVRPVTRCSSSMPGHGEAVISAQFSPDGRGLASGSGDTTVRIWDTDTELPQFTCKGHKNWVLCIAWSPDAKKIASACKNGQVMVWDAETGVQIGKTMSRHKQWVTYLAWQPMHKDPQSRFLASAGKDGNIFIWDTLSGTVARSLTGHTASVTSIRWGGEGLIYSGSQDRSVKVWRADDGVICRSLAGHAHWINTLALNTDYALRTSCFDAKNGCVRPETPEECQKVAAKRYADALKVAGGERLVSGSDDFTLFLWNPAESKQAVARLTGHQQLVNQVVFSPDTRYIASASFDKSVKLWCGRTGKYLSSLRGHVNAVYQVAWSADSRLLVSGSADSTLKVWDMRSKRLHFDLPGHGDEVYTVDWSLIYCCFSMSRLLFCLGVSIVLRVEYLVAAAVLARLVPEWSSNKARIFSVRVVSFTHATLSALGCLASLLFDSNYVKEPYDYSTDSAEYVFLFSMGYFIYDMMDMFIHGELPNSKEYVVHHSLVITAFSIILWTGRLFGFAMIALLVEVQTIFLHLRTMVRLAGHTKRGSFFYDSLINANMICLFLFRHAPISYLLYFLLVQDDKVPIVLKTFLTAGLSFLTYHNTHLTIAMSKSDGFFGHEMQQLDEDDVDPLGSVKKENTEKAQ